PTPKRGFALERADLPDDGPEDVLAHLLGVLGLASDAEREPVDLDAVAVDQRLDGARRLGKKILMQPLVGRLDGGDRGALGGHRSALIGSAGSGRRESARCRRSSATQCSITRMSFCTLVRRIAPSMPATRKRARAAGSTSGASAPSAWARVKAE